MINFLNKKIPQIIIKALIVGCVFFGLFWTMYSYNDKWYANFVMYTDLSNLLVLIEYVILLVLVIINYPLDKKWVQILKISCNIPLLLTFIIFGCVLTPLSLKTGEYNPFGLAGIFKHFIGPSLMIFDYFVIDRKFDLKIKECLFGCAFSILYLAFVFIRAPLTGKPSMRRGGKDAKYPYFFFDADLMGYFFEGGSENIKFGIIPSIILLVGLLIGISLLTYKLKKIISEK